MGVLARVSPGMLPEITRIPKASMRNYGHWTQYTGGTPVLPFNPSLHR